MLEGVESELANRGPIPSDVGTSEASKRDRDRRVVPYETPIEITKPKEGLNVLHFPGFRPINDGGNFVRRHPEAFRRQDVTEIFAGGDAELALGEFAVESGLPEAPEHLPNMFGMLGRIVGIDQYVVQIDDDVHVQQIREQTVQEPLKSGRSIGKAFRNNPEFEGPIARTKRRLRFVTRSDPEEMVCVPEIKFCIDASLPGSIEEIGDERKRIAVLLRNPIKTPVVDAQPEATVLLLSEENRSSMT